MSLAVNPNNLVEALLFVEDVTGRTCAESMNRAGLHTIIGSGNYPGAMQLTPKATRADIAQVSDGKLRGYVINRAKKRGTWPLKTQEIREQVKAERRRRQRAIGFAAYAGWNNASKAMGGRGLHGITEHFARSTAAQGSGRKATRSSLTAIITNTAAAAERIGEEGLQQGLDNAARDLVDYATKKIQQGFKKVT